MIKTKRINFKKVTSLFTLLSILALSNFGSAFAASNVSITDDKNGNWADQHVILRNTPEADLMVRTGDIDNLGFGWPQNFDPFSGNIAPWHSFPWEAGENDAQGTDRIFVVSSYNGNPPNGTDGYTNDTKRPDNIFKPIELSYTADNKAIKSVVIQAFVDDFQAPVWGAKYVTSINGVHTPFIDDAINALAQTGPVGNLITINVPKEYLYLFKYYDTSGNTVISLSIDDNTTGAGDGYAIDFVKLLIDYDETPVVFNKVTVTGTVTDGATGKTIADAVVSADGGLVETRTDLNGTYTLKYVPVGRLDLNVSATGYLDDENILNPTAENYVYIVQVNFGLFSPPQLLPEEIHVDKNALSDILTSVVYGTGKLDNITNGAGTLIPDVDYKLLGNTVTISKWYLNYYFTKFPEQNLYLDFNTNTGRSVRLTVYTGSTPYVVLSPDNLSYELNSGDVKLNLTPNGNYIASINSGSTPLVQRVDYSYDPLEKILYIRKGFLADYFSKNQMPLNLTVNFTGGESKIVVVTLK